MTKIYLIARANVLLPNLLKKEDFNKIKSFNDIDSVIEFLKARKYKNLTKENFEIDLYSNLFNLLNLFLEIALDKRELIYSFFRRYEIENIKRLIISKLSKREIKLLDIKSKINFVELTKLDDIEKIAEKLKNTLYYSALEKFIRKKDFFVFEEDLDRIYFNELLKKYNSKLFHIERSYRNFLRFLAAKKSNVEIKIKVDRIFENLVEQSEDKIKQFYREIMRRKILSNRMSFDFVFGFFYLNEFEIEEIIKLTYEKL